MDRATEQPSSHMPSEPELSHIRRKWLDVPYADQSPAQQMDLFLPDEGEGPFPLIVHIHGGAFRAGDKRDFQVSPWLEGLKRGFAVASINYRMSGEAIFPAAVIDCKAAIRFLRGNARQYTLDPSRVAVVGGSAGGNLAEMVAVSSGIAELTDPGLGWADESESVQACISWFGPTDFLQMDRQLAAAGLGPCDHDAPDSPESEYMGGQITILDPAWVQRANPITYISDNLPPLYLQHGSHDHLVPMMQSRIFAEAIETKLGAERVRFEILAGADHGGPEFIAAENMDKMFNFLERYLSASN